VARNRRLIIPEKYYNIHDIVRLKIVDQNHFFNRLLSNVFIQYENFESQGTQAPDIVAFLGEYIPANEACSIVDDKYFVKNDYVYCSGDSHKRARWTFELSGFEGHQTVIRISHNVAGGIFVQGVLLDFLIKYELNRRGFPMIHASAVSRDNRAYAFAARSGGGKTTIALNLLEHGFRILGDNFVILNDGVVRSYLSPLNLFTYNLVPTIRAKMGSKDILLLRLKALLYRITAGYAKLFTKINPQDAFPDSVIDSAPLDMLFVLIPRERFNAELISKEEVIGHLMANQKLDFLNFIKYASEYSFVFPESRLATHWETYEDNLQKNLGDDVAFVKVEVPRKYDSGTVERFLDAIHKRERE
jgi:hypothetical protein